MNTTISALVLATLAGTPSIVLAQDAAKPTIVLVHGAFADSSGWNGVIADLVGMGYPTIAAANPLRSVSGDAAEVAAVVKSIAGDVVLVGHSYGGMVISEAAIGSGNVRALVYVAGFIPYTGESAGQLSGKFPGSTLGSALLEVALADGNVDLYIDPTKFHQQFAADVASDVAQLMAATQRPITQAALGGAATGAPWQTLPTFTIFGTEDKNIPVEVQQFMADRAEVAKVVPIDGGSHALMVSHPKEVAAIILDAAEAVATASAAPSN
jgi:pimeloyl-ACP methyl ester carboxylesterase